MSGIDAAAALAYASELAEDTTESFPLFRHSMYPDLLSGWWLQYIEEALDEFLTDFTKGRRPKMLLVSPPQHGKSRTVTDFLTYAHGEVPDLKTMFGSYADDLGVRTNRAIQRAMESFHFKNAYPDLRLAQHGEIIDGQRFERSTTMFELLNYEDVSERWLPSAGSFRNTTVSGETTGHTLDLGVLDDPIKGRAEASSKVIRDKTWNWIVDDFFSRFSDKAGLLMIMTRWHVDDPAGRWLEIFPETQVVSYEAIASKRERYRKKGEALFPALKSLDFLLERKRALTIASWESLYQGKPIVTGGGLFPIEKFKIVPDIDRRSILQSVRYWDKAGTEDGGKYTAGVLMHKLKDGTFYVEDLVRGQWDALKREQMIKQCAQIDNRENYHVAIWVEQEPGSGGKESAESSIRNLAGYAVAADKVTGEKEIRAEPYAAQVQGGNVLVKSAEWTRAFIDEHEVFPQGKFLDQVDAAAGAFNKLTLESSYNTNLASWVGSATAFHLGNR